MIVSIVVVLAVASPFNRQTVRAEWWSACALAAADVALLVAAATGAATASRFLQLYGSALLGRTGPAHHSLLHDNAAGA